MQMRTKTLTCTKRLREEGVILVRLLTVSRRFEKMLTGVQAL